MLILAALATVGTFLTGYFSGAMRAGGLMARAYKRDAKCPVCQRTAPSERTA